MGRGTLVPPATKDLIHQFRRSDMSSCVFERDFRTSVCLVVRGEYIVSLHYLLSTRLQMSEGNTLCTSGLVQPLWFLPSRMSFIIQVPVKTYFAL